MFKDTIIENALAKVAKRLNIKACETVLFENRHKHIDEINTILRKIYHKNEIKIVDVGGGLGINLMVLRELLNDKKIELYLVDRFVEYNEDNKMGSFENIKNLLLDYDIKIINQDIVKNNRLIFDDDEIDVVTILDVVEHLPTNPNFILKEIFRILKPGGTIILSGPNLFGITEVLKFISGRHPYMDFNLWMQPQYFSHFREYTKKEYEKILLNSGFTSVKSSLRLSHFKTRFLYQYWKRKLKWYDYRNIILAMIFLFLIIFPLFKPSVLCEGIKPIQK